MRTISTSFLPFRITDTHETRVLAFLSVLMYCAVDAAAATALNVIARWSMYIFSFIPPPLFHSIPFFELLYIYVLHGYDTWKTIYD